MVQLAHSLDGVLLGVESDFRILWVGSRFPKMQVELEESPIEYALDHVDDLSGLLSDTTDQSKYDCVIINFQEADHSQYLRLAMVMAKGLLRRIFILVPTEKIDFVAALPGVSCVFETPASASKIVEKLNETFADREEYSPILQDDEVSEGLTVSTPQISQDYDEEAFDPISADGQDDEEEAISSEPEENSAVTKGFETSISIAQEIDHSIWKRFLPLANFLYKKLAILALGSLFLTFLAYGAMIVFYLASSSWSLPFELSAGHKIVQKMERDLSQLRVSQNLFRQQLTVNTTELSNAVRKKRQGQLQIDAIGKTIQEELYSKQREKRVLQKQLDRLMVVEKQIIADRNASDLPDYFASLKKLYKNKMVSRRAIESVRLNAIESEHRLATLSNEIAGKREQLASAARHERQLGVLLEKVDDIEFKIAPITDSKFSHMVSNLMSARTAALAAKAEHSAAKARQGQLRDSLHLVTRNIESVIKTPMARAIENPVAVLFVPYQNSDAAQPNEDLYGCRFFIFICRKVGTVGKLVDGETVATHPLFDKPMRGYFVEAVFDDRLSVTDELLHFGRAPMLF